MDYIRSFTTKKKQSSQAVEDIVQNIHNNPQLILFFASTVYDFEDVSMKLHESYPNTQVVGVTTTGEIGTTGYAEGTLSVQSYAREFGRCEAVLMRDIVKYPIFDRPKLIAAAKKVGIQPSSKNLAKEGLALVFPVGLKAAEEKMLSVVNSIFEQDGFTIFGGTAGDDAQFVTTKVSVNGEISQEGGATVFIKPNMDFYIQKENIFEGTGKKVKITKANAEKRIVYEMDGRPAAQVYAEKIGTSVSSLNQQFSKHPLGRKFNEDHLIASPFQSKPDGSVEFYCQVYEGAILEILQPKDVQFEMQQTITRFQNKFEALHGVLGCNCILRKLQFKNEHQTEALNKQLKQLPNLSGFSSYGEQYNKSQLNQTLLLIGFGKLR